MYTKRILNSDIIANIKVCSIQMQCVIKHKCVYSKRFELLIHYCTALNICLF